MDSRYVHEPLPFNLVNMTFEELYLDVENGNGNVVPIPTDIGSDNDSDVGIENEIVLSASDKSDSEWEADDLIPLAQMRIPQQVNITWTKTTANFNIPGTFTENYGVPQFIKDIHDPTPFDIFNLFITNSMFDAMVFQTNLYAEQEYLRDGKTYKPTDINEIKTFIGINLLMGIKRYPSYRDHWSSSPDLHDPFISKIITMHRFGWLLSHLHLNDNSIMPNRGSANFDKLFKVRPLIDEINANFKRCFCPHENVAIDEAMIKFKGRSTLKQYMPKKPIKRGYKVWLICDETGYCFDFEIYTGRAEDGAEKELGARVVKRLASQIYNKNHRLYMDNFFTSVGLMQHLLQNGVYACGTINSNRKNLPKFKPDKEFQRGEYVWYHSNCGLSVIKWRDKRSVHLISNFHDPNVSTEVKRKEKDGSATQVPCPQMLVDYNKNMNFVDKFDQIKGTYCVDRKSHKWWHRIFFFFIDACVVNAFIIYNLLGGPKLNMKSFRREVISNLTANTLTSKMSLPTEISVPIKKRKPTIAPQIRMEQSAHQPMRTTRRRCAFCSTKKQDIRTNWKCSVCGVPLCLGKQKNCFQSYHRQ